MEILLCKPRGFCAGVERAIRSVEKAIQYCGAPVYVLNDIVHNAHVVETLRARGAVFVKSLEDIPRGATLLFSAHGVAPEQYERARERQMHIIDATCPLVAKVHREAQRFAEQGYTIILIGQAGHDEVVGTMGWAPGHVICISSAEEVAGITVPDPEKVAVITQTTLSRDWCEPVWQCIRERFPLVTFPETSDICYATTNRQTAVTRLAEEADMVLVVGDRTSANSNRLAEICQARGKPAHLISGVEDLSSEWLEGVDTLVITAGASTPEHVVEEVVSFLCQTGLVSAIEEREIIREKTSFALPEEIEKLSGKA